MEESPKMKKLFFFSLIFLMIVLNISVFAQDTIKIGILGPMTGPNVDIGVTVRDASIMAMEEINSSGGINGKMFEWFIINDEAIPAKSVIGAKKLIFDIGVDILIGPSNSGCAEAVGAVTNPNKTVNIVPGQSNALTGPDKPFVYRSSMVNVEIAKCMMNFLKDKNFNRIAVIYDTTGYGENWYNTFIATAKENNLDIVCSESFEVDVFDLTPQVVRIKNTNPDILVFLGVGGDVGTLAKAEKRLGLDVPHLGTNGFGTQAAMEIGGADINGYIFPDSVDLGNPKWLEFKEKYRERYNIPEIFSCHPPAQAYDAIYLLAQGLRKTNGEAGEALKKALDEGVSVDGVIGKRGSGGASWRAGKPDALTAEQLTMIEIKDEKFTLYEE